MTTFQVGDKVTRIGPRTIWEEKCIKFGCDPCGVFTVAKVEYDHGEATYLWIKEICPDLSLTFDSWDASRFQLAPVDLDQDDDECI